MENKEVDYPVSTGFMKFFRPNMEQLMSEANKYITLGNIVDSVKQYKENETPLDIQLRAFKNNNKDE